VGSIVGKPIHKPKIDSYDPFYLYIYDLYDYSIFFFHAPYHTLVPYTLMGLMLRFNVYKLSRQAFFAR